MVITKGLVEQAGIQAGLAFFWTLGGSGIANSLGFDPVSLYRALLVAAISAGLAAFTKLSIGTGGGSNPATGGH